MKAKLYGIGVLLLLSCFFASEISAQKNEQLLLRKKEAGDIKDLSKAILEEINSIRQNPRHYISYLEEYRRRFSGHRIREPDGRFFITAEGAAAVDEAIAFLKNHRAVDPLATTDGLVKSADLQLRDLTVNPSLGHVGADGSTVGKRVRSFGTSKGKIGENIAYGKSAAREIVLMWIIDDGVPSRLHRLNIFNAEFKKAGVAYGKGDDNKGLCVLVLAAEFSEKEKSHSIRSF